MYTLANVHGTPAGLMYTGGLMPTGVNVHGTPGGLLYMGLMHMVHRAGQCTWGLMYMVHRPG